MSAPHQSLGSWIESTRGPFLNLLRNLTPQVFLSSFGLLFGQKLDFTQFDIANWVPTIGFFLYMAMFMYAFYANMSIFFQEAFPDLDRWLIEQDKPAFRGQIPKPRLFMVVWRERKIEAVIVIFVLLGLLYLLLAVALASIAAAVNFTKLAHS